MTKQEAIDYIKETRRTLDCSEFSLYMEQALGMAIEALSAQPDLLEDGTLMITVPQSMLEKVKRVLVDEFDTKNCKMLYQDDPERKKGVWIKNSTHINCSVCKHCSWSLLFDDTVRQFNFCPNCGAEMRGENNG